MGDKTSKNLNASVNDASVYDTSVYLEAVKKFGTPLYVYNLDLIKTRFQDIFNFVKHPRLSVLYAMKANYNPSILNALKSIGAKLDTVSSGEVELAIALGFKPENLLYTANNVTAEEMKKVFAQGLLFNIGALSTLETYGELFPGTSICLRFNPEVVAGSHEKIQTGGKLTKFGIMFSDLEKAQDCCKKFNLKVIGLHKHTGSGISDSEKYLQAVDNLLNIASAENFPDLEFLDFGGGFGVPYHPNDLKIDYLKFGEKISERFIKHEKSFGRNLQIWFEPGRYVVAEAGTLLVEVNTIKDNHGRMIAGCNSGFPHLIRPVFYDAYHHILNLSNPSGRLATYDICGNICETGDNFAKERSLPEVREGDILAIQNAGAYCYAMGGIYNLRSMPTEVVFENRNLRLSRSALSDRELAQQILSETKL